MSSESMFRCGCDKATDGTPESVKSDPAPSTSNANSVSDPAVYNWQSEKCCIRQRLAHIFRNRCFTDVVFVVGQEPNVQRIPAHKVLLSAGSKFFEAMFSENWAPKSNEIPLPSDDPVAFSALVGFLYTDDIKLTPDIVVPVLDAAKKYDVPPLESRCVDFFSKKLCPENVFTVLSHAKLFDVPKLIEMCEKIIDNRTVEAVQSDAFTSIDFDILCSFLRRDVLKIKEFDLWQATLRWSEAECARKELEINPENLRSVLGEALFLIRFPTMSMDEFSTEKVAQSGLLSPEEVVSVFLYFSRKKPTIIFSEERRRSPFLVVNRFAGIGGNIPCPCDGSVERIVFIPDQDILLAGIGLYGSLHGSARYEVSLQVYECKDRELVLYEKSQQCFDDSSNKIYEIYFDRPVKVAKSTYYRINAIIKGPDSFCGAGGVGSVFVKLSDQSAEGVKFTFKDSNFGSSHTSVSKGQIPRLLFTVQH